MSVYKNDRLTFLKDSVDSILNQTYDNFDLYISVDGPVHVDISEYLASLSHSDNVIVSFHKENKGLAFRINEIIEMVLYAGHYTFLARMDADDISRTDRFQQQVNFFNNNPSIEVIGSDVIEIDQDGNQIFYKRMDSDHYTIKRNIVRKCPFNHPSVMFKTSVFKRGHRYNKSLKNTQDYFLWVSLLSSGAKLANINAPLLMFRVDNNFHDRRGLKKITNEVKSRLFAMKELKDIRIINFAYILALITLRLSPSKIKKIAYKTFR